MSRQAWFRFRLVGAALLFVAAPSTYSTLVEDVAVLGGGEVFAAEVERAPVEQLLAEKPATARRILPRGPDSARTP